MVGKVAQFVLGGTCALAIMWGCSSSPPPIPCTSTECLVQKGEAPNWINEPQAFSDDPEMVYGLGSASAIPNKSLLRRAAQEEAKRSIASLLNTSVKSSFSKTARSASGAANVTRTGNVLKEALDNLVNAEVVGAKIVAVWANPYSSEAYALAALNKALACEKIFSHLGNEGDITKDRVIELKNKCLKM